MIENSLKPTDLDIFEKVFFEFLEIPSMRWKIKDMIQKYDDVDFAELDIKLQKLALEISKQKEGGDENV